MIKFIAAAIWICAATLGAVFYSFQTSAAKPEGTEAVNPLLGGLDYIKTDVIPVPVVKQSAVTGYFLTKLVYTVDPSVMARLSVPADSMITDVLYSHLFGSPEIDFTRPTALDLDAFRSQMRDAINKRVGEQLVHEILVEQVDYLSKDEIRDNALRRRVSDMKTPKFTAEKPSH
ncbi:hypothetical protein [Arvimicrobium flavum]|uniref:hypothetical protein n=1 Tax=Arvimicrobium flavum TaxID=3393320 RepID=UPI00237BA456|nr:hypothetical protein [Mesorhizobium shangrilense]